MMMKLSPEEINALLVGEIGASAKGVKSKAKTQSKGKTQVVRPIQIGPLSWSEPPGGRCASRNCSSPTLMRVEGVWRCSTHAMYALNYMLLQVHSDWESVSDVIVVCTCNAGKHSMFNIHTSDCPIYKRRKEIS